MNSGFAGSMGPIPGNTLTDRLTGRPRTSLPVRQWVFADVALRLLRRPSNGTRRHLRGTRDAALAWSMSDRYSLRWREHHSELSEESR
jgi:hypothetical protein